MGGHVPLEILPTAASCIHHAYTLRGGHSKSLLMDRGAPEYAQSDQSSVATYTTQDPRSSNISSNNTPQSDYGLTPSSARSSGFPPEHLRYSQFTHAPPHPGAVGTMAQPTNPSISQASPTYPPYSPYTQDGNMQHAYQPQHGMPAPYPHPGTGVQGPPQTSATSRTGQVYSFVPIPGAQQHKRPRRRYEEIERMYKCGWNGCEKAYGTLNHLNAHVTMQSHGQKRTPEEFKEIRKEWKQRKKEEEAARKAEEERQRVAAAAQVQNGGPDPQGPD